MYCYSYDYRSGYITVAGAPRVEVPGRIRVEASTGVRLSMSVRVIMEALAWQHGTIGTPRVMRACHGTIRSSTGSSTQQKTCLRLWGVRGCGVPLRSGRQLGVGLAVRIWDYYAQPQLYSLPLVPTCHVLHHAHRPCSVVGLRFGTGARSGLVIATSTGFMYVVPGVGRM